MNADSVRGPSLLVLADAEGKIHGVVRRGESQDKGAPTHVGLEASDELSLHEIPLPAELRGQEIGPDAFDAYEVATEESNKAVLRRRGGGI
ncbi:hypothetical protein ACH4PU_00790 [Streptomyces sp. NPDC021100]|uniref:hypothetical protein n=1 Tax=Streptomyces sp. NPDC021100 TaxID=3365114 RepID=UPI0037A1F7C6